MNEKRELDELSAYGLVAAIVGVIVTVVAAYTGPWEMIVIGAIIAVVGSCLFLSIKKQLQRMKR